VLFWIWLFTSKTQRQEPLGVVADHCTSCGSVRPFDISRQIESTVAGSSWRVIGARKRCWDCGRTSGCDETRYDRFLSSERAQQLSLTQLLECTNIDLADELSEDGVPVEDARVVELQRPPAPAPKVVPDTFRGLFLGVPWQLLLTLVTGLGVALCGIAALNGELANVSQLVPPIALIFVALSIALAFLKRRLRPKTAAPPEQLDAEPASDAERVEQPRRFMPSVRLWIACFAILIVGGIASASAEIWRLVKDWPMNTNTNTVVASPGQDVKIHLPQRLQTVKGLWSATGSAELLNPPPGVPGLLTMKTNAKTWSGMIHFNKNESETQSANLWAICRIPDSASLRGQTLHIRVQLDVLYPQMQFNGQYNNVRTAFLSDVEVKMAQDAEAADQYRQLTWIGYFVSFVLAGSTGLLLSFFDIRVAHARR